MNRVAFGELYLRLRNDATDQLTRNPERESARGSCVYASNRKGLRHEFRSPSWQRARPTRGRCIIRRADGGRG